MPPRPTRTPTTASLLTPILDLLAPPSPNAYSAHQKALTSVARVQNTAPRVALDLCLAVARELLKLGEGGSGVELAVRGLGIAEGLEGGKDVEGKDAGHTGLGEVEMRAAITQLLALTPTSGPWRKKLADAAIRYSIHVGQAPGGDPELHHYIGELYYKDHDFILAEPHLLASGKRDSAIILAEMMYAWSQKGALDPAPYAVRGVLPYLLQTPPAILPARTFLAHLLSLLSSPSSSFSSSFLSSLPPPSESTRSITPGESTTSEVGNTNADILITSSPTLNFLQLALLTAQRAPAPGQSAVQARGMDGGAARDWEGLVGRYTRLGGREGVLADKEVQEALAHIGINLFLIPPPRSAQPDMLQNLMGSLFGGGGGR